MNKSNVYASMDTKHLLMDVFGQILALVLSMLCFDRYLADEQRKSLLALFIVFIFIFILSNRVANVYNVILLHGSNCKKAALVFCVGYLCYKLCLLRQHELLHFISFHIWISYFIICYNYFRGFGFSQFNRAFCQQEIHSKMHLCGQ